MSKVKHTRTKGAINNVPIEDGQVVLTEGNSPGLYFDYKDDSNQNVRKQLYKDELTTLANSITTVNSNALHESVNDVLGAKNLLEITAESKVTSGVTFTVDKQNGTVTTSGAPTANTDILISESVVLDAGTYILSGVPNGGSYSTYYMQGFGDKEYTSGAGIYTNTQEYVEFTLTQKNILSFRVHVRKDGYDGSTKVFRPMIRPAAYESTTFAPYAKSNRELTLDAAVLGENAGKNLLNPNTLSLTVKNGITPLYSAGGYKFSGTSTARVAYMFLDRVANNYAGYILSCKNSYISGSTGVVMHVAYFDSNSMTKQKNVLDGEEYVIESSDAIRIEMVIENGTTANTTLYPMLRPAGTSPDFAPYMYSNHEITTMMEGNENKNLLEITAESQTVNGVTFTVDKKAGTVTANGTASANISFYLTSTAGLGSGTYILSGCPSGGSASTYYINGNFNSTWTNTTADIGSGKNVTVTGVATQFAIAIISGTTVSNLVFRPMIRYSNTPPDFVPYRKTNEILTKEIDERWSLSGGIAIPSGADLNSYTAVGNYYCESTAILNTLVNVPPGIVQPFTMKVLYALGTSYPRQHIEEYSRVFIYERLYSTSWGGWIRMPTRDEIISINSSISGLNGRVTTLESSIGSSSGSSEGYQCVKTGQYAHAEGYQTSAIGDYAHSEGCITSAQGAKAHAEGYGTTASGEDSHAEGLTTKALGACDHAEGDSTVAGSTYSHAEGQASTALNVAAHAEGYKTYANSKYAHSEGYLTSAFNQAAHTEGTQTKATADSAHAEGTGTCAGGMNSHVEGSSTRAAGSASHAEGGNTTASTNYAHAEGQYTKSSGVASHSEGQYTTAASGIGVHAEGIYTYSNGDGCHAGGHYNVKMSATSGIYTTTDGTAFVIGNGTATSALSNAFSIMYNGTVKAANTITASTTADYAEYFEWADSNPDSEDRTGYFVTLDKKKIRIANSSDDYILGVISGAPFVLGNGDCDVWNGMVIRDEFNRIVYEPAPKMEIDEETGESVPVLDEDGNQVYQGTRPVYNPDYDNTQPYISRADRPEWDAVGMVGCLRVRHDGTAEINKYVTVNDEGKATVCDKTAEIKYRVVDVINENVCEIVIKP